MELQDWVAIAAMVAGLLALPAAAAAVRSARRTSGEHRFRARLSSLHREGAHLTRSVLALGAATDRNSQVPMLVEKGWIPEAPYDLNDISIVWRPVEEKFFADSRRSASRVLRQLHLAHVGGYSSALVNVAGMKDLFDGRIYRLVEVRVAQGGMRMTFTESTYFAYLDTSEVLALEAVTRTSRRQRIDGWRSYRRALANPFDLENRVVGLGVDTLTIRVGDDGVGAGFFLHRRDPARVVNNPDMIGLIPAGEFTPSDMSSEAVEKDFDLWLNIMREYAEELLGVEEARGRGGQWIDYATESPYRELAEARKRGDLRIKVLGLGIDPLPWKPELLTVCIIDAASFDSIFSGMLQRNDEGLILSGRGRRGLPFDAATVNRYCNEGDVSPNAKACLLLAWRFRSELGLVSTSVER